MQLGEARGPSPGCFSLRSKRYKEQMRKAESLTREKASINHITWHTYSCDKASKILPSTDIHPAASRPGEDLMPEILKQCTEWTSRQVQAQGGAKAMYEGAAETAEFSEG